MVLDGFGFVFCRIYVVSSSLVFNLCVNVTIYRNA